MGSRRVGTRLSDFTFPCHFHALEKEMATHSSVLSCLENPRDGAAWWAAVYGVAQSRTWLKRISSSNRKAMTNLDSILKKQRHHFADKGPSSQIYGFSSSHVWMWELEHKEGWMQRIDSFQLWYWRKFLRVPWTARRSNQSILKKISPEYSLQGLMLKLKHQYFGHLMWRSDSL